jgi:hypothetical protein
MLYALKYKLKKKTHSNLLDNLKPIGIVTESLLIEKLAKTSLITIHESVPWNQLFDVIVSNNIRRLIGTVIKL